MQEEYVRKLFEARVAVMGFKCRQLQLQGEVDHLQGMVSKSSETVSSCNCLHLHGYEYWLLRT